MNPPDRRLRQLTCTPSVPKTPFVWHSDPTPTRTPTKSKNVSHFVPLLIRERS